MYQLSWRGRMLHQLQWLHIYFCQHHLVPLQFHSVMYSYHLTSIAMFGLSSLPKPEEPRLDKPEEQAEAKGTLMAN